MDDAARVGRREGPRDLGHEATASPTPSGPRAIRSASVSPSTQLHHQEVDRLRAPVMVPEMELAAASPTS